MSATVAPFFFFFFVLTAGFGFGPSAGRLVTVYARQRPTTSGMDSSVTIGPRRQFDRNPAQKLKDRDEVRRRSLVSWRMPAALDGQFFYLRGRTTPCFLLAVPNPYRRKNRPWKYRAVLVYTGPAIDISARLDAKLDFQPG